MDARSFGMLVVSCLVIGVMAAILTWFFRRLSAIQQAQWGNKPDLTDRGVRSAARRLVGRVFRRSV